MWAEAIDYLVEVVVGASDKIPPLHVGFDGAINYH